MRLATYNVEWFSSLFDDDSNLVVDDGLSGRRDVTRRQQIAALGTVFQALDADAVMVIEAPDQGRTRSSVNALERFAQRFELRARRAVIGFSNGTQQEIALMFDPDVLTPHHDPRDDPNAPMFDQVLGLDVNVDATADPIRFSKPPLELAVKTAKGSAFRMIGVHAKSKAPHGARNAADATRISIENRRKQLAQCIWLRRRVLAHLAASEPLIVLGDFNDGPGIDEYEQLFGHSGVEIVLGTAHGAETQLYDPHAAMALQRRLGAQPTTARFLNWHTGRYLSALLDYIMVSPDLAAKEPNWCIWHPFDDPKCWGDQGLRDALLTASDHFPVSLDIDL